MKKALIILAVAGYFSACTNDNLEELHPPCDTTVVVSFANDLLPIFAGNCSNTDGACHADASAEGNVGLANYNDVMDYLQTGADDTTFVQTITHDPDLSSSLHMPKNQSAKMDACNIMKIQAWINRGKLNN